MGKEIGKATIKNVAERSGVSIATVSYVINGTKEVKADTRERVLAAMKEIGYYPNYLARSMRRHSTHTIGLIIPDISNFYYTGVAEAVERYLKGQGYHIILSNSYDDIRSEKAIIELYNSLQIDGVIMVPAVGDQRYLEMYVNDRYPVVFVDRCPSGIEGDCVILENTISTYKAINYLIKKGYKNIALLVGDIRLSTSGDRIDGYKKAFQDNHYEYSDELIFEGRFTYASGYELAEKLIANRNVDAAFFANEAMTIGALSCFQNHGLKVPEDIAVISCNDFRWTEITNPPLTVVSQPSGELGEMSAKLLLDRINTLKKGGSVEKKDVFRVPTKMIARKSC